MTSDLHSLCKKTISESEGAYPVLIVFSCVAYSFDVIKGTCIQLIHDNFCASLIRVDRDNYCLVIRSMGHAESISKYEWNSANAIKGISKNECVTLLDSNDSFFRKLKEVITRRSEIFLEEMNASTKRWMDRRDITSVNTNTSTSTSTNTSTSTTEVSDDESETERRRKRRRFLLYSPEHERAPLRVHNGPMTRLQRKLRNQINAETSGSDEESSANSDEESSANSDEEATNSDDSTESNIVY